ncbi:PPPDE putative peptidase domain [Trypanosoma melophagium]|uniref:PPPDE putative peptidase domain n=1 Tax=Trypanosoma melophagium TaxID=715481 RepID=UPI00351A8467|nr:PPPDE putative peptidase domain [Trypanosoma melophagium]
MRRNSKERFGVREPFEEPGGFIHGAVTPSEIRSETQSQRVNICDPVSPSFFSYSRILSKWQQPSSSTPPPPATNSDRRVLPSTTASNTGSGNSKNKIPSFSVCERNNLNLTVSDRVTLVLSEVKPAPCEVSFTVSLHVYDLTNGLFDSCSEKLVGVHVSGIYHSSVICYGMEFFFEGGIASSAVGRTRFGKKYETIEIGKTSKTLSEFMSWIHRREKESYRLTDYHVTKHNCHNFTTDAVTFLVGSAEAVPRCLTSTIQDTINTRIGGALEGLTIRFIKGIQYMICNLELTRMLERKDSSVRISMSSASCGIDARPPQCVIIFRVDDARKGHRALELLMPYVVKLVEQEFLTRRSLMVLKSAVALGEGIESIDPKVISDFVEIVVTILMHNHVTLWGPVLNGLRIALLHKGVLTTCVYHPFFLGILANGTRDFMHMTADGKLGLLRVLCNLSSDVHGAVALNSNRFMGYWVSAVGLALMDYRNTAITYTGAALAVNLSLAAVLTTHPMLSKYYVGSLLGHPANELLTVLFFYLKAWPSERIPEPVLNMMLLAIFFLVSSSNQALRAALRHPLRLNYMDLLKRAKTNESIAIISILHGLKLH